MRPRILCVDDDANTLTAHQRTLGESYDVVLVGGGDAAVAALRAQGPFTVVIADMHMPGMNGIRLLQRIEKLSPDSIRIMLTGAHDLATAMEAINKGHIFRFLTKPCASEDIVAAVEAAVIQHHLVTCERVLLEKTLGGSIKVLVDILALVDPEAYSRSKAMRHLIGVVGCALGCRNLWELNLAVLLAPIGYVSIPAPVLARLRRGDQLADEERDMVASAPGVASSLLISIPRLDGVARIVLYQDKRWDGGGFPDDGIAGAAIPLGSRILKVLNDLIGLEAVLGDRAQAYADLATRQGWYDADVVRAAAACLQAMPATPPSTRWVRIRDLLCGMTLVERVEATDGTILLGAGHRLSPSVLERLRNYDRLGLAKEPVHVELDAEPAAVAGASDAL